MLLSELLDHVPRLLVYASRLFSRFGLSTQLKIMFSYLLPVQERTVNKLSHSHKKSTNLSLQLNLVGRGAVAAFELSSGGNFAKELESRARTPHDI